MASKRQDQANRRNALRSTGPRTPAGKRRSSKNAIMHGILARDIVLLGESEEDFEQLREELIGELRPDGSLETQTAERIVILMWRLRRLYRAEVGELEIAKRAGGEARDRMDARLSAKIDLGEIAEVPFDEFGKSPGALKTALEILDAIEEEVKENSNFGVYTKHIEGWGAAVDGSTFTPFPQLRRVGGPELRDGPRERVVYVNAPSTDSEAATDEQAVSARRDVLLAAVEADRQFLRSAKRSAEAEEDDALADETAAANIPPAPVSDKLIRYEAHLDRQLARALDRLNRLQRGRLGAAEPPTLRIESSE